MRNILKNIKNYIWSKKRFKIFVKNAVGLHFATEPKYLRAISTVQHVGDMSSWTSQASDLWAWTARTRPGRLTARLRNAALRKLGFGNDEFDVAASDDDDEPAQARSAKKPKTYRQILYRTSLLSHYSDVRVLRIHIRRFTSTTK